MIKTFEDFVNEEFSAFDRLNATQDAIDKMVSYISYKQANGQRKSDSWYDKIEDALKKKSYSDLQKLYIKYGGKPDEVNESKFIKDVSKPS